MEKPLEAKKMLQLYRNGYTFMDIKNLYGYSTSKIEMMINEYRYNEWYDIHSEFIDPTTPDCISAFSEYLRDEMLMHRMNLQRRRQKSHKPKDKKRI